MRLESCWQTPYRRAFAFALLAAVARPAWATAEEPCSGAVSLATAEQRLLLANPDLQLARRAIDAARADLQTAGERPNPTLNLSSSGYDVQTGPGHGSAWRRPVDTVVELEQPLERGGKRGLRREVAQQGVRAASADFDDQLRQSTLALRQAFHDLHLAGEKLAIDREVDALQAQTLQAAERRLAAGDISQADLARLRVEAFKASNDVRQAEADTQLAGVALGYLMGCPRAAGLDAADDWPAPAAPDGAGEESARADVVAAQQRLEQAHRAVALARAAQTRDISVSVQYEHYPGGVPAPERGDDLVGVGVSIPLFIYHAYDGELARSLADEASADDALLRVREQAAADLAQARNALASAADQARNYREQILPQAQQAADAIEYAYAHGALPLLDLLDARRTLRSTRIEAVTAQADYAKALAAWDAATERYGPGASADSR
jgi:cobalt-zinc-cadmium efflux system outer membrane protein